jgi:uncharacterized protein (TIGR00661 family)
MNILFAICSWGLGHAVRDLPLIRRLLELDHTVTVVGIGRSLEFVRQELGQLCTYYECADYSPVYSNKSFSVTRFVGRFPLYMREISQEHKQIEELVDGCHLDRIVSDSRFGVYHPDIPSFLIFHQLRYIVPGRIDVLERLTEGVNQRLSNRFEKILVPDVEDAAENLSGELSHGIYYFKDRVVYLGFLCDIRRRDVAQDLDYFISLSGPEPQRTQLEKKVLAEANRLRGKVVVTLGKPEDTRCTTDGDVTVYGCLGRRQQEEMMNRARMIVTRPGYTTLMELAVLRKKALFIPTPGQTEQLYLADFHLSKGNFYRVMQSELDLPRDVEKAREYEGVHLKDGAGCQAENRFVEIVVA